MFFMVTFSVFALKRAGKALSFGSIVTSRRLIATKSGVLTPSTAFQTVAFLNGGVVA